MRITKQCFVYIEMSKPVARTNMKYFLLHETIISLRIFCTVGEIYTPIFSFFRKRIDNFAILELGSVSIERSGNTYYFLFLNNNGFLNSQKILWNWNCSIEFKKTCDMSLWKIITRLFIWDRSQLSDIDNTFPKKRKYWCV